MAPGHSEYFVDYVASAASQKYGEAEVFGGRHACHDDARPRAAARAEAADPAGICPSQRRTRPPRSSRSIRRPARSWRWSAAATGTSSQLNLATGAAVGRHRAPGRLGVQAVHARRGDAGGLRPRTRTGTGRRRSPSRVPGPTTRRRPGIRSNASRRRGRHVHAERRDGALRQHGLRAGDRAARTRTGRRHGAPARASAVRPAQSARSRSASQAVNPLEMTNAYATLAEHGVRHWRDAAPAGQERATARSMPTVGAKPQQVLDANDADLVTDALEGVVHDGTGTAAASRHVPGRGQDGHRQGLRGRLVLRLHGAARHVRVDGLARKARSRWRASKASRRSTAARSRPRSGTTSC